MKKQPIEVTRREVLEMMGVGSAALVMGRLPAMGATEPVQPPVDASGKVIPGFEKTQINPNASKGWQPFSDRKIRVGIAGYGMCHFGAAFGFQNHPNVEVGAV